MGYIWTRSYDIIIMVLIVFRKTLILTDNMGLKCSSLEFHLRNPPPPHKKPPPIRYKNLLGGGFLCDDFAEGENFEDFGTKSSISLNENRVSEV